MKECNQVQETNSTYIEGAANKNWQQPELKVFSVATTESGDAQDGESNSGNPLLGS